MVPCETHTCTNIGAQSYTKSMPHKRIDECGSPDVSRIHQCFALLMFYSSERQLLKITGFNYCKVTIYYKNLVF